MRVSRTEITPARNRLAIAYCRGEYDSGLLAIDYPFDFDYDSNCLSAPAQSQIA